MLVSSLVAALGLAAAASALPTSKVDDESSIEKRVDLGVPTSWREFGTSLVKSQRNTVALNAMNAMINLGGTHQSVGGLGYWQSANVWSALVLKDLNAGTTDFIGKSLDAVGDTYGQFPNFRQNQYNDDTLWWASAAIYQYKTYANTVALGWAENSWADVAQYQITGTSGNGKSFSWSSTCSSQSTVGGVFWTTTASDDSVNAITTGLFMTLSAYLYEVTGQSKYLSAATAALGFIQRLLYNSSTNLVNDTIHVNGCSTAAYVFTYNSGKYIEGLAVLGAVTGNSAYTNSAITTANAAMKTTVWQGSDGIITEAASNTHSSNNDAWGFKGLSHPLPIQSERLSHLRFLLAVYIRGLAELYRRNPSNSALQILIHSYVDTQANALIELASNTKTWSTATSYSANWEGPYDASYAWTQLAALDALGTFVMVNSP